MAGIYWQPSSGAVVATSLTLQGVTIDRFDQTMGAPGQTELPTSAAVAGFAMGIEQNLSWKTAVIDFLAAPPAVPTVGDRYIASVTGVHWVINYIYTFQAGGIWLGDDPRNGDAVLVIAVGVTYVYNGANWVQMNTPANTPYACEAIAQMSTIVTPTTLVYIASMTEPGFVVDHVYRWLIVTATWGDVFAGLPPNGLRLYVRAAAAAYIYLTGWVLEGTVLRHTDLQGVPAASVTHTQINSWLDQSVKVAASPTFTGLKILDTISATTADLTFNGTQLAVNRGMDVSRRLGVFSLAGGHYATVGTSSTTGILELTSPADGIAVVNANDSLQRLSIVVDGVGNVALTPSGTTATTIAIGHPTDTNKQYRMVVSALGATEFRATSLKIEAVTSLKYGTSVNEFSIDPTFAGDSDEAVPTEKATKAYITTALSTVQAYPSRFYGAEDLANPMDADWPIQSLAALVTDNVNRGLLVRSYTYNISVPTDGAGFTLEVPAGATTMITRLTGRSRAVGGSPPYYVRFGLYHRQIAGTGVAVPSWSFYALTNQGFLNIFYYTYTYTDTLANIGLTAGLLTQFELVRIVPSTTPVSVELYNILNVKVSFT